MAERSTLKRDAGLSMLGVLMSGGAQFAVSLLVARWGGGAALLGPVRGGLALANTASLLWPSTAGQAASIHIAKELGAENGPRADAVQWHLTVRAAQALVVLTPAAVAGAVALLGFSLADAVWVGALVVALSGYHLARGVRFGRGSILGATAWEGANAAVSLGLMVLVLSSRSPGWLLAPLVVSNCLYAVGTFRRRPAGILEPASRRDLDQFIVWGVAGTLASAGLLQVSMVLAQTIWPGVEAGGYAAAVSLGTPLSMAARALSMALVPSLARLSGGADEAGLTARTDQATRGLVTFLVPAFVSLMLIAEPLMLLVYGAEFLPGVWPLRIILAAVMATSVSVACVNAITVRGTSGIRRMALYSWAGLIAGVGVMIGLGGRWGIVGLAVSYLIGTSTTATAAWIHQWRRGAHRWWARSGIVVLTPGLGLVAAATTEALSTWGGALAAAAVFSTLWSAGVWFLGRRARSS